MSNSEALKPGGTATGEGWQYRVERDGNYTTWQNWSETFELLSEPSGSPLQTGIAYWLHARNPNLPDSWPGSAAKPLYRQFKLSASGRPVAVDSDGSAYPDANSSDTSGYTNAAVPAGNCKGADWQYRIGRGNLLGDWQNWTPSFSFSKDPDGSDLKIGVIYHLYGRSLSIASGEEGSIQKPFVASFELLSRSQVAPAVADASLALTSSLLDELAQLSVNDKNAFLGSLLNTMNQTVFANFCAIAGSCPYPIETDTIPVIPTSPTFDNYQYYLPIPEPVGTGPTPTTTPSYAGGLDFNNCEKIGGWVGDKNNPNTPQTARIECDGKVVGRVTATSGRDDVKAVFVSQGAMNVNSNVFGFSFDKPVSYNDGQSHTWRVFVGDSTVECQNNVANSLTCAAPSNPNTPYPVQLKINVAFVLHVGGASLVATLIERMSDGSERTYASGGTVTWSVANSPANIVLTPATDGKTVSIKANTGAATGNITLNAAVQQGSSNGSAIPSTLQVVSDECQRPTGLTTYQLNWKFIPQGGYGRQFTTLDDAIQSAGKKYDGAAPGALGPPDPVQAANLNVGTTVYAGTGTDCGKYGSTIAYVTDASGGNTLLKAVLIVDGIIKDVKASDYVTPSQAPVVTAVAIWRTSDNKLYFLYKSSQTGDQQLEDFWAPGLYGQTSYLHSSYGPGSAAYNPDGYKDYYYLDSYGYFNQDFASALLVNSQFKVRKQNTTTDLVSITFKAPNLALGEIRSIYPQ